MNFYDREWNLLPIKLGTRPNLPYEVSCPGNLSELIEVAETLAEGFPHVRVDLYRLNDGRIYFGEMTFTPSSGYAACDPPEWDLELGQLFSYPGLQ